MLFFEWNDNLKTGNEKIDEQHKKLIEMINLLYTSMKKGEGKNVLEKLLKELLDYTQYHFETEEKFFNNIKEKNFDKHIKEHNNFTFKIKEFKIRFESGEKFFTIELLNFLKDWLLNHIRKVDIETFKNI
ncbi:MAG: bacteriohemerythrin [candidate division WOR-3 bacterium]